MLRRRVLLALVTTAVAVGASPAQALNWYPDQGSAAAPGQQHAGMTGDGTVIGISSGGSGGTVFEIGPGEDRGMGTYTPVDLQSADDLAVNRSGEAVAAALHTVEGVQSTAILERRGGEWAFAELPGEQLNLRVAVAADGRAAAAWSEISEGAWTLEVATRSPAGAWSAPVTLDETGFSFVPPHLAFDAAGGLTVAWIENPYGEAALRAAHQPPGGSWSATETLGGAAFAPGAPHQPREFRLAARAAEEAVALVETRDASGNQTRIYSTALAAGTWSAPVLHDEAEGFESAVFRVELASLATNPAGDAAAAWVHIDMIDGEFSPRVHAMTAPAGGDFGADADISGPTRRTFNSGAPTRTAISDDGEALVVWADESKVLTALRPAGEEWEAPQAIPRQPAPDQPTELDAGADGQGRYLVLSASTVRRSGFSRPPVAILTAPFTEPVRGEPFALSSDLSFDPDDPAGPGNGIAAHAWDLDDDGAFDDASGANASVTLTATGVHRVAVRVTDGAGDVRVARRTLTLGPVPAVPGFTFSPAEPLSGELVTFTDTTVGTDGAAPAFWDWRAADDPFQPFGFEAVAQRTFFVPGTYPVTLSVSDALGTGYITRDVVIGNRGPVADYTVNPASVRAQDLVELDGSPSSDPDHPDGVAGIRRYEWDLDGDGGYETDQGLDPGAVAAYGAAGTVDLGLRVTDVFGDTAEVRRPLAVGPAAGRAERPAALTSPAAVAAALARARRPVRFRAPRAGVLGVRFEARGRRRLLAASAVVFRGRGTQVVRIRSTRALRRARSVRVRVTWTPRGAGRATTATRVVRRAR